MSERSGKVRQSAVALTYGGGDAAPRVVAKGQGLVAEQIMRRAQEAGVFVHESKELVQLLMGVDLDREIPPALYRAIAELLAWLYHIESAQSQGAPVAPPPDPTPHLTLEDAANADTSNELSGNGELARLRGGVAP